MENDQLTAIVLTHDPIDIDAVSSSLIDPAHGAIVTFIGRVRENSRGQRVTHLTYEAYVPMAEKQLAEIGKEAAMRWNISHAITHRLGNVRVGECSVVVAAASAHRDAAFAACSWLVDSLKATVPIWKKEYFEGGACWIAGSDAIPSPCDIAAPAKLPHD